MGNTAQLFFHRPKAPPTDFRKSECKPCTETITTILCFVGGYNARLELRKYLHFAFSRGKNKFLGKNCTALQIADGKKSYRITRTYPPEWTIYRSSTYRWLPFTNTIYGLFVSLREKMYSSSSTSRSNVDIFAIISLRASVPYCTVGGPFTCDPFGGKLRPPRYSLLMQHRSESL